MSQLFYGLPLSSGDTIDVEISAWKGDYKNYVNSLIVDDFWNTLPGSLSVSPGGQLNFSGNKGGAFNPLSFTYTLTNIGGAPVDCFMPQGGGWLSLSSKKASLKPGDSENIVITINGDANTLNEGVYNGIVDFVNVTNGQGSVTYPVSLTVRNDNMSIPAAVVSGPVTAQTITGSLMPARSDIGSTGSVFVMIALPADKGGGVYFLSPSGIWTVYNGTTTPSAYFTGALDFIPVIAILRGMDISTLIGVAVYVGYGKNDVLAPASSAFNDMVNKTTYSLIYTVR